MSFFVDANILLYSAIAGQHRERCASILDAIAQGAEGHTSAAVLEEVWHHERKGRIQGLEGLTELAHGLFSPLLPVTSEAFGLALTVSEPRLGTNDRVHVGTCIAHGIGTIVTADRGFDHARGLRRVDPGNPRALRRLLG